MTTNQPLSLFISSKMTELATERRAIQAALSQYKMHGWLWEKDAGARPEPIDSTYLKEVEACDLYIGLFWLGYGPYTIEEYEHARKHHKKCLVYEKYVDIDQRDPQLQAFLDEIQQVKNRVGLTVCRFETAEKLAAQVQEDVIRLLTTTFRESRQQPGTSQDKRWRPPKPPVFEKAFVGRHDKLDELITHLSKGQSVAITGKTTAKTTSATLQGMGGIGKTYLAYKLATDTQNTFLAGVIWLELGPKVTDEAGAQVPLLRLAGYIPDYVPPSGQLYPEQVAALIEEMTQEPLLVVFDDVWHQAPLRFLARALPANAVRLVTTRYANIAQMLGGKMVTLDRLTPEDGLALLEDRLDCQGEPAYRTDLENLVALLDGHALALDITAALIKKRSAREHAVHMVLENLRQGIGQGKLNILVLPPSEERDENLEKSLALSYERMNEEQQSRFRALGVFAPESPIAVEAAAAVWSVDNLDGAQNALLELVDLALLSEVLETSTDHISYRQHGLLRVYARALLETAGEFHNTCIAHAQFYTNMAWHAETANPRDYPLLEQHFLNLQAALEWAVDHQPELFARLMDGVKQFLRLRGQLALLETYLPKAITAASAIGSIIRQANLLRSLGDLESRLGNLDQARSHYDAALPLYRAERNRLGEANLLRSLGDLESRLGNIDQAHSHYDAALPLYRAERARLGEASIYTNLGYLFLAQEDQIRARTYYELALPLFVAEREPIGQANTLIDLGRIRFKQGEYEQGMQDIQEAARLYHFVREEEWASRAEQYLVEMRSQMEELE